MALRAEVSIPVALGTAGLVYAIHTQATPPQTDIRMSTPGAADHDAVNRTRKQATWLGIGVVSAISLLARDATIAVVGGAMVIGLDWWTRYNNETHPAQGRVLRPGERVGTENADGLASVSDMYQAANAG